MIFHQSVNSCFSALLNMLLHALILVSFHLVLSFLSPHFNLSLDVGLEVSLLTVNTAHSPASSSSLSSVHTACLPAACLLGHPLPLENDSSGSSTSGALRYSACSCHQQLDSLLAIWTLLSRAVICKKSRDTWSSRQRKEHLDYIM